ncbi:MAG: 3-phosphoshikimate 1-carboxyvinyltransferase [Magnetococcales bacterium]|nr:3-phosphoshikimate 1-carboxyvinyltransferase [Magnetococcales bacterium]
MMEMIPVKSMLIAHPGGPLRGEIELPGDKSISHRAVIFGALADGESVIHHLLEGEDVLRTVAAFQAMGVAARRTDAGVWHLRGVGLEGLSEPEDVLDMGNSGTGMRLLAGLLAGQPFFSVLTGDESLRSRPMGRVAIPLARMGARILGRNQNRYAPLAIQGTELTGIEYVSPVASAQVKTALLLAGLNAAGRTVVSEPALSRDHTERMLAAYGVGLERHGLTVAVTGGARLRGVALTVPGDISSAAFPMVAALLVPDSDVTLRGVGINPTRTGLLDLLLMMGADITLENQRDDGGEPVADLRVRHSRLHGIQVPPEVVPRAIDEFPVFALAAACAVGETVVTGAEELRVKESDRIQAIAQGLGRQGADIEELPDGMRIRGNPGGLAGGARAEAYGDHRIAMTLMVAGLAARRAVTVTGRANVETSFPGFGTTMATLGGRIEQRTEE